MRSKPLVLVAEDNATLRRMLKVVLTRSGYDVVEAVDGLQAVNLAEQHRPDLLLMDIRMPELNGIEALRQIRTRPNTAATPAMMLTGLSQRSEVIAAARAGANYFLAKGGFDIREFLGHIKELLADQGTANVPDADPPTTAKTQAAADHSPQTEEASGHGTDGDNHPLPPTRACFLANPAAMPELADHRPPITPSELYRQVSKITQVRALPFVLPRVLALTASQYSSADSLVTVIQQDVGLTSKVLAIANSSLYRRDRDPVTSLHQAVKNIGFSAVRQAALALGLMDLFPHQAEPNAGPPSEPAGIDRVAFWEHSFASGSIARLLAGRAGMDASQAFIVGLLHNIGLLIYDDFFSQSVAPLLALLDSGRPLPPDLERRWMGVDHARLAGAVLREWHMPEELYQPIADHLLSPANLLDQPEPRRRWAGLVKLADHLATCLGLGDRRIARLTHVDNDFVDEFAVDDDFLLEVRDAIPAQLREMKLMLLYSPKSALAERSVPVSDRPLLYLCPRTPHVDIIQYYLRLRYSCVEAFTNPAAFALRLDQADSDFAAVVNLLPATAVDHTAVQLDRWARTARHKHKNDATAGGSQRYDGLVLARADQVEQLTGPFGQAFDGLVAPVAVKALDRFLVVSGQ